MLIIRFPGSLIMSRFTDVDITVTLPDGVDACDVGTFTIWAQQERLILTRIEIPRNIFVSEGDIEYYFIFFESMISFFIGQWR